MAKKETGTAAETKQVVKKEKAALPMSVADLEALSGQGFENTDKDSYAIPFLRILQPASPQVQEDEASYIEGAKPGMMFNTITNKLYGKEARVIPITYNRSFIEWIANRGGFVQDHGSDPTILDRIVEVDDKHNSILDNGNIIQDTRTHIVLLADEILAGPVILSMTSTGIKHSRKWMTLMNGVRIPNSTKQAPMFACIWKVGITKNENDDGKWYQFGDKSATNIHHEGWVDKDQLAAALQAFDMMASGTAKADWDSTVDNSAGNTNANKRRTYEKNGEEFYTDTDEPVVPF